MSQKPQTIGLLALCAAMTFGAYCLIVLPLCVRSSQVCFMQWQPTLDHTADAPYRYRVLAPALEAFIAPHDSRPEILEADVLLHAILFPLLYLGLYRWLGVWVGRERALLGCFVLATVFPVGFLHYYLGLFSGIELVLLVWFLVGLTRRWPTGVMVALVVVAALNRETSLLLVGAYAAYRWREPGIVGPFLELALAWALVTIGLHLVLGDAPHVLGFIGTLHYNMDTILEAMFSNLLFIPLWLLAHYYSRGAQPMLRRLLWCVLLYMLAVLVGAAWQEVRLLLTVFPLVLPIALTIPERIEESTKHPASAGRR